MNWATLRATFPALNPAQLHWLLTQYQLASAMGPMSAWEPGAQDSPEAFQSGEPSQWPMCGEGVETLSSGSEKHYGSPLRQEHRSPLHPAPPPGTLWVSPVSVSPLLPGLQPGLSWHTDDQEMNSRGRLRASGDISSALSTRAVHTHAHTHALVGPASRTYIHTYMYISICRLYTSPFINMSYSM